MTSNGNAFENLPDLQLEDLTTTAVTTFVDTRRRFERIIDDKNASLQPSKKIPKTLLKTAIAPHVLTVICRHHVKFSEDDLTEEIHPPGFPARTRQNLPQGRRSRPDFLGVEIENQMNLKPFDRVEKLACQCDEIIQTHGLEQIVGTKAGKKKWRQVIISQIEPKVFYVRLGEADQGFQ
jgi:hypothetical protein